MSNRQANLFEEATHERRPHNVAPVLSSIHVLFAIKDFGRNIGICNIGLGVTAVNCINVLRRAGIYAEMANTHNAEEIQRQLEIREKSTRHAPVSHVIISSPSWVQPEDFQRLCMRWPEIEFVLLDHSGCAYLSMDKFAMRNIRDLGKMELIINNLRIGSNNPRVAKFMSALTGREGLVLPNLYDCETFIEPWVPNKLCDTVRIGSFGAARAWKNQLVAAEAAIMLARKLGLQLEFFVNSRRPENNRGMIESRMEMFDHLQGTKLIEVPWEPWPRFRHTVANMHIMFSPSFDETFCVVVADGIAEGVPSVVGACIEWAPKFWMAETFDPEDLTRVASTLLHDPLDAVEAARKNLRDFVKNGLRNWVEYLTRAS